MNNLFDSSRIYYAFRRNYYHWGHGPIMDEYGKIIGKYNIRYKKTLKIQDINSSMEILLIKTKVRSRFEIHETLNNIIARIRAKYSYIFLEDKEGTLIMKVKKYYSTPIYNIVNPNGNLIAEVHRTKYWSNLFNDTIFEFGDTFGIKISDSEIDKKLLLGLIMAIDWIQCNSYLTSLVY